MKGTFGYTFAVALAILALAFTACQRQGGEEEGMEADTTAATAEPEQSLYDRLGGEPAIAAVIDDFVARAAADTVLNFTRQGTANEWEATPENIDTLKMRLVQFVGQATGGPQVYEGQDMGTAHQGMEITNTEFDILGGHLKASLDVLAVPAQEQGELLAIVETTRSAIVMAE